MGTRAPEPTLAARASEAGPRNRTDGRPLRRGAAGDPEAGARRRSVAARRRPTLRNEVAWFGGLVTGHRRNVLPRSVASSAAHYGGCRTIHKAPTGARPRRFALAIPVPRPWPGFPWGKRNTRNLERAVPAVGRPSPGPAAWFREENRCHRRYPTSVAPVRASVIRPVADPLGDPLCALAGRVGGSSQPAGEGPLAGGADVVACITAAVRASTEKALPMSSTLQR